MNTLNSNIIVLLITVILAVGYTSVPGNGPAPLHQEPDVDTLCDYTGCEGGLKLCALISIPRENNPVARIYLCYESMADDLMLD